MKVQRSDQGEGYRRELWSAFPKQGVLCSLGWVGMKLQPVQLWYMASLDCGWQCRSHEQADSRNK